MSLKIIIGRNLLCMLTLDSWTNFSVAFVMEQSILANLDTVIAATLSWNSIRVQR